MTNRIGHRPVTSTGRRCVVRGCPEQTDPDTLICHRHAEALRPAPTDPKDAA